MEFENRKGPLPGILVHERATTPGEFHQTCIFEAVNASFSDQHGVYPRFALYAWSYLVAQSTARPFKAVSDSSEMLRKLDGVSCMER